MSSVILSKARQTKYAYGTSELLIMECSVIWIIDLDHEKEDIK